MTLQMSRASSKNAIQLIRVSTEGQARDDKASIPAQRAANVRTAIAYGLTIIHSVEYSDVSGAAVMLAPEMQELIRLIADPNVHGVIAREFSRLMRPENFTDYALLQHFVDTNTILYLPDGPIDFASKTGRILGPLRAALAGVERMEILERIWTAKEEKRKSGGFGQPAICLPYGVTYEAGWRYTSQAIKVKEAFRLLLAGHSYTELAKLLGVSIAGLKVILRNPIYTGWRVIDERRDIRASARMLRPDGRQGGRRKMKRAAEDVIRVKVIEQGLISDGEYTQAQTIIESRQRMNARIPLDGGGRYVYNGLLSCSMCGRIVYTHFRRADYYVCKGRKLLGECQTGYMRRERLDPKLDELFAERFADESFWRLAASELLSRSEGTHDTSGISAELNRLEGRRVRVLEAFFDGTIERPERDARLLKLDGEIAALRSTLSTSRPPEFPDAVKLAELFEVFDDFAVLGRKEKRALLMTAIPEIQVADYIVTGLKIQLPRGDNFTRTDAGLLVPAFYLPLNINLSGKM